MHPTDERADAACVGCCCSEESRSVWVVFCESRGHTTQPMLYILDAFSFFWAALQSEQRAAVAAAWGETVCAASTAQNNTTCCTVMQQAWQAANKPDVHQVSSYRQLLWLAGRYFILHPAVTRHPVAPQRCTASAANRRLVVVVDIVSSQRGMFTASSAGYFLFFLSRYQCLVGTSDILHETYETSGEMLPWPCVRQVGRLAGWMQTSVEVAQKTPRASESNCQHTLLTTATVSNSQDSFKKKKKNPDFKSTFNF